MKSGLLATLFERGFINQCTDLTALDDLCSRGPIKAYIGFDLTANSLHVGSLIQIMVLRHLLAHGHQPVVLLGSATTKIGDPTGKDAMRPMLSEEAIRENKRGIFRILSRLTSGEHVELYDNRDWFDDTKLMEYLRDYGPHFTINRMLTLDSVRSRLERQQPMTFLEFNYMLFQAIDFRHLSKEHGVELQIGGSDQWGNIVNGVDLVRRMDDKQVFGLTTPLLTNSVGEKMGKTGDGAVWLDPEKTSPYEFWQYWRNVDDNKVYEFMKLLTDLGMDVIDHCCGVNGDIVGAKELLADEVTMLVHGEAASSAANLAAKNAKSGLVSDNLDQIVIAKELLTTGYRWGDMLVACAGISSMNEAFRMAQNGAFRIDGNPLISDDIRQPIPQEWRGVTSLLTIGKKRAYKLIFEDA
jgi:tyrosyl-tRNA synthetase